MARRLPDTITKSDIVRAFHELDAGRSHNFADSTEYDVLFEGRRYPPKAVVGVAAEIATGESYAPPDFSGGIDSKCFRILEAAGFTIVEKAESDQSHMNASGREEPSAPAFVRIHNNSGIPIKATFTVEVEGGETSIIVGARGGTIGAANERNAEYTKGVDLLLSRLAANGYRLQDALVDTRTTIQLSPGERRLGIKGQPFPIELSKVTDLLALRLELCAAQKAIGRGPEAKGQGNSTKRMRLFVEGEDSIDPNDLAHSLAIASPHGSANEEALHEELLSLHSRVGAATGGEYRPNYFLKGVRNRGGLKFAKDLLAPGGESSGFDKLAGVRRADLSVEAIALNERFVHLFTRDELKTARERLASLPLDAFPADAGKPAERLADELPDDEEFIEGAAKTVKVNRYERDQKARAACLKHFGAVCQVCGLDFAERYGADLGEGFMHVHHKRPIHTLKAKYKVNPKKDLVPVCPNCHAMLHRKEPPLDIEQLRARIDT